MAVLLKIDGQTQRFEGEIIAIGRAPSNQLSLPNDARLAAVQAVLRLVAGRWIIESQGASSIKVGTGRPTRFAWLSSGDVIHVTESGPDVIFITETDGVTVPLVGSLVPHPPRLETRSPRLEYGDPQPAVVTSLMKPKVKSGVIVRQSDNKRSLANKHRRSGLPPWVVFGGAGGLVTVSLICLGMYLGGLGRVAPVPMAANPSPGVSNHDEATVLVAERAIKQVPEPVAPASIADPRRALFCLMLRTADRSRTVQIGTAWSVASRRLVTSGDAARAIALLQEHFPTALARHTLSGREFELAGMSLHPQYEAAANKLDQALREIRRLTLEVERTTVPEEQQVLNDLLRKLNSQVMTATDETINVNVATLELSQIVPATLPWATSMPLQVGQQVTLLGHPLPQTEHLVDPDHPIPVQQWKGRLQHAESPRNPVVPARTLMRFDDSLSKQNWSGSPVLNGGGAVIGLYIRPTPRLSGPQTTNLTTHDVTVLDGLRDWLRKSVTHRRLPDASLPELAKFEAAMPNAHQDAWAEYLGAPFKQEMMLSNVFKLIPTADTRLPVLRFP